MHTRRQVNSIANRIRHALHQPAAALLLKDPYRSRVTSEGAHPVTGHCYVASEVLYHALGGKAAGCTPMFIRHEGEPHWFVRTPTGDVDVTAEQFATPVPYQQATAKGFLTAQPSRRARELARLAKVDMKT